HSVVGCHQRTSRSNESPSATRGYDPCDDERTRCVPFARGRFDASREHRVSRTGARGTTDRDGEAGDHTIAPVTARSSKSGTNNAVQINDLDGAFLCAQWVARVHGAPARSRTARRGSFAAMTTIRTAALSVCAGRYYQWIVAPSPNPLSFTSNRNRSSS